MIKYLGSKRRLVPVLSEICRAAGARTALDLFTGTTRVAQAFKAQGVHVTAVDSARYAHVFARTYVEADAASTDVGALEAAVASLDARPGVDGYVTEMFSRQARFFQPHNAARIDAVREAIETEFAGSALHPLLLTSLIEAADRVDSTTGLQMAYVKQWAPRSFNPLALRVPQLLEGPGRAVKGDAVELAPSLGHFDLAYLDPPYNQHRYFTNYHVWETLVAWDAPEAYGVARKRIDARDPGHALGLQLEADDAGRAGLGGGVGRLRPARPVVQRRGVARARRARGDVRAAGPRRQRAAGGGDPRVRLGPLRGCSHRDLRPLRAQGRPRQPRVQSGVAGHRGRSRPRAPRRRRGAVGANGTGRAGPHTGRDGIGDAPMVDRLQQST